MDTYNLVFSGELVRGADPEQARRNIGQLFKISDEKVQALFSGKPVVLKKNLDFATANKYRVAIKKAGCRVDLVENKPVENPVEKKPEKAVFQSQELKFNSDQGSEVPQPKKEEKKADTPALTEASTVKSAVADSPPLPIVEEVDADDLPTQVSSVPNAQGEKAGGLSIAETGGNLVDETELDRPEPVHVDVGNLSVQSEGGDLLSESEKTPFIARDIAVDATLAPTGSNLIQEEEIERLPSVEVDTSDLSVADVGVDLGQEKDEKKTRVPDVSHLSVE